MESNSSNMTPAADAWNLYCENITFVDNATLLQQSLYQCLVTKFAQMQSTYDKFDMSQSLTLGVLGLIGSFITLITLIKTESVYFKSPTYRYFRILAIVQSLVMVSLIHSGIRRLASNQDKQWFGWYFITVYIEAEFGFFFATWADLIVCYLSLERAIACLRPSKFQRLQQPKVFTIVIVSTFIVACVSDLPKVCFTSIVWDPKKGSFNASRATGLLVRFFDILGVIVTTVKCVLSIGFTIAAIYGFMKTHRLKIRVLEDTITNGQQQRSQLEWKITAQLCLLQIAQAVPTVANSLTVEVGAYLVFKPAPLDPTNLVNVSDDQLMKFMRLLSKFIIVMGVFNITKALAHSSHPYLFLCCSRPFRKAVRVVVIPQCLMEHSAVTIAPQQNYPTSTIGMKEIGNQRCPTVSSRFQSIPKHAWTTGASHR